jgi:hypothetical protein
MQAGARGGYRRRPPGALRMGRPRRWVAMLGLGAAVCTASFDVGAQVPATLNGPPVQVQPMYPEPGIPLITINPGTVNPFSNESGDTTGATGGGDGDQSSTALSTMLGTTWGAQAVNNADALGVNASALAATCVLESGCQNVSGSGSIAGAFQMSASTYTAMINQAVSQDPSLAGQIVPGLAGQMDPATESIAASEYLLQGAQALQNSGIANPTVLQVRGYYNFGPTNGVLLATASTSATMSSVLQNLSPATLAANGITPGETVGQWETSVTAKIGAAAGQSVLNA